MRLYRVLLFLYPAAFRAEYGDELIRLFSQKYRDASGIASLMFWFYEIFDTFRNAVRVHWDIFRQDLVHTLRLSLRTPGFAMTAILVTALGIGANTAVFSVVNHVLIRPLPYPDAERIVRIWEGNSDNGRWEASPANYRDWKQRSRSFEQMGTYSNTSMNLVGKGNPEKIQSAYVTADLLPLMGVQPVYGRLFSKEEDRFGSAGTALISFGLWQSRFGSSGNVLGQTIRLNDEPFTVIGVLPSTFTFPDRKTRIWITYRFDPKDDDYEDRDNNWLYAIGKLKPGVSLEQARAEMAIIAKAMEREHPLENAKTGAILDRLKDGVSRQSRLLLAALMGASLCVLLIACTNLANLFLVRAMGRRRELTVRSALGAGRERIVRQLFTESLIFASVGAVIGILLANVCVPLLSKLIPAFLPVGEATVLDFRVLGFATLLLCATVVGFSVVPAIRVCSTTHAAALREGYRSVMGDRKERLRSVLVVAEVMASVILLISSGLLIRALWSIQSVDPGFRAEQVWTMQTPVQFPKYEKTARRVDFYSRVLSKIHALPDISNAAFVSFLPIDMGGGIWPILKEGGIEPRPGDSQYASLRFVTPGFFDSLKIPVRLGRDVNESDTVDSPFVAVVSESFVRDYWPELRESPIGRRFHIAFQDRMIVGVVGDICVRGLERRSEPQVYLPYRQQWDSSLIFYVPKALVIRTNAGVETPPYEAARKIIQEVDPEMPIAEAKTLQEIVEGDTASRSTQIRVMGTFAILSLLLAGVGIHGLLAFAVSQRIPEIGLRIALGASSNEILKIVVSKAFYVAAIGSILGMFLGYFAGRMMQTLLADIKPFDPSTFLVAMSVALLMTLSGCLVPALRALRVDPLVVMRAD